MNPLNVYKCYNSSISERALAIITNSLLKINYIVKPIKKNESVNI